jgi:hypothetical protein
MLKTNLKHQRTNGDIETGFSTYCPKCGFYVIEKEVGSEADFDDNGWYNVVKYSCTDSKCKNTWTEKVYITPAGTAHYHAS